MNIIQVRTTTSSALLARTDIVEHVDVPTSTFFGAKIPFNFFYVAENGDTHKTLLRSYEVIFEMTLTQQTAIQLLYTPWTKNPRFFDPEHPVNKTIIQNYNQLNTLSLYIPIYQFYRINNDLKIPEYTPKFRPRISESPEYDTEIKVHLPKQTLPSPCILCEKYPNHLANECFLLRAERGVLFHCPNSMKLHIPRRLL